MARGTRTRRDCELEVKARYLCRLQTMAESPEAYSLLLVKLLPLRWNNQMFSNWVTYHKVLRGTFLTTYILGGIYLLGT